MMLALYITLYGNFAVILWPPHGALRRLCGYRTVASRCAIETAWLTYGSLAVAVRLPWVALRSPRDFDIIIFIKRRTDTLQFVNTYAVDRKAVRFP